MIRERERAGKIVNLLMEYYINNEYSHINVDVVIGEDNTKIVTEGIVNVDNLDIKELESILTNPRVKEYDSYFERLTIASDQEERTALGYLVDDFNIELKDNTLLVEINRRHN